MAGLVAACSGSSRANVALVDRGAGRSSEESAGDSVDIVIQLSGLILIVPPTPQRTQTHLFLPRAAGHYARLGFPLAVPDAELCVKHVDGICYVDLENWEIQPLGARGGRTEPAQTRIPTQVVNVTRMAGSNYRAHLGLKKGDVRSHVVFETGRVTGTPCGIGRWTYPPGSPDAGDTATFANVIEWRIRYKRGEPFAMTFVNSTGLTKSVSLITAKDTWVLLAHVQLDDLLELPPEQPTAAQAPAVNSPLDHVDDYYDLLRHHTANTPPGAANRPVPTFHSPTGVPYCRVSVTKAGINYYPLALYGIKTYGCVIGSGEG
jgi:hypothetical protein